MAKPDNPVLVSGNRLVYIVALDLNPGHLRNPTIMTTRPSETLEVFDNPQQARDYTIRMKIPEFTCLCPMTGQPDFATILIDYIPDKHCLELKALKLYMWSYRDKGAFHEAVTNKILDDVVAACQPRYVRITGEFLVRGGIYTNVIAEHRQPDWQPPTPVILP